MLGAAFFLNGCSNSLDDMVSNYNNSYTYRTKNAEAYTIDNVSGEDMLRQTYAVYFRSTLCLTAPAGAASYEWKVTLGENAKGLKEGAVSIIGTTKNLNLYIAESSLERWCSYKLTLTVKKESGLTYSDTADLYVY